MAKKQNGNIRETITAIDFVRTVKGQAPNDNATIRNILTDNERILMERLFQLSRQDKTPVMDKQQPSAKKKSKGKEVTESSADSRRQD